MANRCMPPCSYARLGRDGEDLFKYGPIVVTKGNSTKCVAMSMAYADALEAYIESLAMTPLLDERGAMDMTEIIAHSQHTGEAVGAVAPAMDIWKELYAGTRQVVADIAVRPVSSDYGPPPVVHYDGFCVVKENHVESLRGGAPGIVVYFVFRKEPPGSRSIVTLIGIKAGYRQACTFDPSQTGPFFTDAALATFLEWQRQTIQKCGDEIFSTTGPTEEEMETAFYREKHAALRQAGA
jgi:hypothetical protein